MSQQATSTTSRARVTLTISKDSMAASMIMRQPSADESEVTLNEILEILNKEEVSFGIDEASINQAIKDGMFNKPVKIASGNTPEQGISASFIYHFDTSDDRKPKEDESGHVDYKDIDFIQNVSKGDKLVTKVPPTPGRSGMTVMGKEIKGPTGRDKPFEKGANTEETTDGFDLIASVDGAILYQHGKVSVNDVVVIKGDIDHTVGNLDCRGSVRVSGGIKAGYELKIDGDLEVNGNVEDSIINVKGDIFIKGGFYGNESGELIAGGDITLKYAEGQKLTAGNDINIGGEMINCRAFAGGNIYVKGKRGKIIGGEVKAEKIIRSAYIGSEAATTTHLIVAYNPELMTRYSELVKEMNRIKDDGERVKEALYALYRLKLDGKLTADKSAALEKLEKFKKELPGNIEKLLVDKQEIEDALAEYKDAVIIAEKVIYPGVKASFGIIYRDIIDEREHCKLYLEGQKVMLSDFKEE